MVWLCHALFNPQLLQDIWVVPGVGLWQIKLLQKFMSKCARENKSLFSGI